KPNSIVGQLFDNLGWEVKTPIDKLELEVNNGLVDIKTKINSYLKDVDSINKNISKLDSKSSLYENKQSQIFDSIKILNNNVISLENELKLIKGVTNLSKELAKWDREYSNNSCNYPNDTNSNICREIREIRTLLQQKLPY
ncbi:TPA: hypothetical protein ACPJQJ_001838, partial [Haemophilus influenzae]